MKKLREVKLEININSSKEQIWDLLFDRFGEVNNFNPLIDGSHHTKGAKGEVGCERHCDIDSKNWVHEKITDSKTYESFDIDIIKGGLPMMDVMKATYKLKALSENETQVSFVTRFSTKPSFLAPFMKGMMANMLFKMLVGLKFHLETGNQVTKENIKTIMKDYKQLDNNSKFAENSKVAYAA